VRLKVIAVLAVFFVSIIALTAIIPNASRATTNAPTPTPNLLLGTQSPEEANLGFPSPMPTLPPPTDLYPDQPDTDKYLLVFRTQDGSHITFLAPLEKIEEQAKKIGVDFFEGAIPPHLYLPRETDGELEAVMTAEAVLTANVILTPSVSSTTQP
jgi:hypothetical protein